jgi:hypothetical protein
MFGPSGGTRVNHQSSATRPRPLPPLARHLWATGDGSFGMQPSHLSPAGLNAAQINHSSSVSCEWTSPRHPMGTLAPIGCMQCASTLGELSPLGGSPSPIICNNAQTAASFSTAWFLSPVFYFLIFVFCVCPSNLAPSVVERLCLDQKDLTSRTSSKTR